jgi:hypothetical protein
MLRIPQKDENVEKYTEEDFRMQTAYLRLSNDTVAILDASLPTKPTSEVVWMV